MIEPGRRTSPALSTHRMDAVSIVVPTYRRATHLASTLDALIGLDFPSERLEILVVDDAGGDVETAEVVTARQSAPMSITLLPRVNGGAAAARNTGARAAAGDLLIFCDDDILVGSDNARLHVDAQTRHPRSLVNGVWEFEPQVLAELRSTPFGRYRLKLQREYEYQADGRRLPDGCFEAEFLSAQNLGVGRQLFVELGGFDEDFPYAGAEDQDLSLRARGSGCLLIRDHRIKVLNNEPTITLGQFCTREERSAETFGVLVSKFPHLAERRLFAENASISGGDSPTIAAKKLVKLALSSRPVLGSLHRVVAMAERLVTSEIALHRVYRGLVGLHIFRGVRNVNRRVVEG
jgi:GT2 family glycosyltransferase